MTGRYPSSALIVAASTLLCLQPAQATPADETMLPSSFLGVECGRGPVDGVGLIAVCHQDTGIVTVASIGFDVPPMDSEALRGHWDTQYGGIAGNLFIAAERFIRPDAPDAHALRITFKTPVGLKYYWASWHDDRYTRVMVTPHGSPLPDNLDEQVVQTFFNQRH